MTRLFFLDDLSHTITRFFATFPHERARIHKIERTNFITRTYIITRLLLIQKIYVTRWNYTRDDGDYLVQVSKVAN